MIGLLLQFTCYLERLMNQFIILEADNVSCNFAWENRHSKNETISPLIQTLHIFEAALECQIFVKHVKRKSSEMAKIADNCSRILSIEGSIAELCDIPRTMP